MGLLSFEALNGNNIPSRSAPKGLLATQRKGLLGLGGVAGPQSPAGLLGPYYDPAEERRRKISGAMTQAGLALLTNGKGSFGEVLGQGLAGAVQGAENAGHDYREDAFGYQQLAQQQADRQRQIENDQFNRNRLIKQDAWTNTEHQQTLDNRAAAEKLKTNQQSAIMDWAHKKESTSPGFLAWAQNFPEEASKVYSNEMGGGEQDKPTEYMREYFAARQQGFAGTLQDWIISNKKAGATNVTVGGADGNFDKELSKGVAGVYTSAMEAGQNAVATKSAAQQLRVLMKGRGGSLDGLSASMAPYLPPGLVPEGASDVVAAQAIIAGLVPKQRVPGSGTTSDFDARKFAESLPSLWNKPGANDIITNTMESYADYQIAVSNVIADVASNPQIANKAAAIREHISQIPDPFEGWKQYMAASGSGSGGGKVIDGYTIRRVQ